MRIVLGGFVLGIATLQQRAQLPGSLAWTVGSIVLLVAVGWVLASAMPRLRNCSGNSSDM